MQSAYDHTVKHLLEICEIHPDDTVVVAPVFDENDNYLGEKLLTLEVQKSLVFFDSIPPLEDDDENDNNVKNIMFDGTVGKLKAILKTLDENLYLRLFRAGESIKLVWAAFAIGIDEYSFDIDHLKTLEDYENNSTKVKRILVLDNNS